MSIFIIDKYLMHLFSINQKLEIWTIRPISSRFLRLNPRDDISTLRLHWIVYIINFKAVIAGKLLINVAQREKKYNCLKFKSRNIYWLIWHHIEETHYKINSDRLWSTLEAVYNTIICCNKEFEQQVQLRVVRFGCRMILQTQGD